MIDTFVYRSPLGPLGLVADKMFLEKYMRRLLTERAEYLKRAAEGTI